ncbi:NAD(P)/FAD-dependent oxidoreductase (plasmid) [Rhizobium sp. TH2]|uniref:NAD(P)/FAD-dependent oxidoreductase n=1 Tax=Rhizobium sp. TH2 TaxID=2775403 RepID=UPI00215736AF|nr:NAD(P)/FAD-dependent oxidoreductase [Rhizobium sp. TH2]UVC12581.1 NAD(P)/FAD-dependent oxidoreductase [Rhizobium sp. TH2]
MRDCVIVGGGPAGLTAALYLARYHLSSTLIDGGKSRAALIPLSHNHAGFPDGISGRDLLERIRRQLALYPAELIHGQVESIDLEDGIFRLKVEGSLLDAKKVLLATGVINHRPQMPDDLHDAALMRGLLRYCPVCDGYEITDKDIAVTGSGSRAYAEAKFLRSYTASIAVFPDHGSLDMCEEELAELSDLGITVLDEPPLGFSIAEGALEVKFSDLTRRFASVYPALGSDIQSDLAVSLGAERSEGGCLWVDKHQRTTVPNLYAAGDLVLGLDQISHAMGQAAVAATAIRNDLSSEKVLQR